MPTIAIVGAGPGLGQSVAKMFGRNGFNVALISRNKSHLDPLVDALTAEDITAAAFQADILDRPALASALRAAADQLGVIDVLEFSPHAGLDMVQPTDVSVDNLQHQVDFYLHAAVTAVHTVLPAMTASGSGSLLFTVGGGSITPYPMLSTTNIAQAGLRNWAHNLHNALGPQGIHVSTIAINLFIGGTAPEGVPHRAPDDIAADYWTLHTERTDIEHLVAP